jgi:hypothetical protein
MFSVGCSDAPADHTVTIQMQRKTAAGTGGAAAFAVMDADTLGNIGAVAQQTLTVSPTLVASSILYKRSFNTKYGFDFYPAQGGEIIYPAVAASGIAGVTVEGIAPMWLLRFEDASRQDRFVRHALRHGVLFKRGAYNFASLAHDEAAVAAIERAASSAFVELMEEAERGDAERDA